MVIYFLDSKLSESKLEELLNCAICLNKFKDPVLLPCNHSFCKQCITDLLARSNNTHFSCPICKKKVSVPENGFFPADFKSNQLLDLLNESKSEQNIRYWVNKFLLMKAFFFCFLR